MKVVITEANGQPIRLELDEKYLAQGARMKLYQALYQTKEESNAQNSKNGKTPPGK